MDINGHNNLVEIYKNSIAIIGAGISGLALGIILNKQNIKSVIFEKSSSVSEYGAGISISKNGQYVLSELEILDNLRIISGNPQKAVFFSGSKKITSIESNVVTTSRKSLYDLLLNKYIDTGGELCFNHELINVNNSTKKIFFKNGLSYEVNHIAACDGINSICRFKTLESNKPQYSGYSVWRSILDQKQQDINFHLGPNFHVVTYPINEKKTSFVAAVKKNKKHEESWYAKGTYDDLKEDIPQEILMKYKDLKVTNEIYKWGVFVRPKINLLFSENITFLGDAAHPIVPFIGQGGCLALEDSFLLGNLFSKYSSIKDIQINYQRLRQKRIQFVAKSSFNQGKLNHLKHPLLIFLRNYLMKNTQIIKYMTNKIWNYRPHL